MKNALPIASTLAILFFLYSPIYAKEVNKAQNLPKEIIKLGSHKLLVELAISPFEKNKGLMHKRKLNKDEGMLFIFKRSIYQSFWMKNTYIPLDIGFFDKDGILLEYKSMKAFSLDITFSTDKAKYVLEVNKGWFRKNKIKIGTKLTLPKAYGAS